MNLARAILHGNKGLFAGMRVCLSEGYIGSALVLAYSLIDVLAWLGLPDSKDDVLPDDFIAWAEKYVIPFGNVECKGKDLYAARCGVLHTFTPSSKRVRQGRAVPIVYSWGNKTPYPRAKLQRYGISWIMLHVDSLCAALEKGAAAFWEDVEHDPARLTAANVRADVLFKEPPYCLRNFLERDAAAGGHGQVFF
jgi:hypothetical protein